MRSDKIKKILRETSLEIRVKNAIEAHFIVKGGGTLISPLDENGNDIPSVVEANRKCLAESEELVTYILKVISKWKEDKNIKEK